MVRFSSHGGFVAQNTDRLKDDAVHGDVHTVFDLDFITDFDVVFVDGSFFVISKYDNLNLKSKIRTMFSKIKLINFKKLNLDYLTISIDF